MTTINKADFTGYITQSYFDNQDVIMEIEQVVDKFSTKFLLLVPNKILQPVGEKCIQIGDKVLITNALMYQKGDKFLFRINSPSQIQPIEVEKNHNLGFTTAREKFI